MDNSGRFVGGPTIGHCELRSAPPDTELGEFKSPSASEHESPTLGQITTIVGGVPCRNGACKGSTSAGSRGGRYEPHHLHSRLESPWHYLKTCFLVSTIVALLVWILVYVLLTQYEIL